MKYQIYHNENGPDIGCGESKGIIEQDGLFFKDLEGTGELLPYEDWRLPAEVRAEDLAKWPAYRESFDLVVSRAVANMSTLSEYCLPFVKKGGYFVAYKTREASAEIEAAAEAVRILGGGPVRTEDGGSGDDGHIFAVVEKTGMTPGKYPRKAGLPSRQTLGMF